MTRISFFRHAARAGRSLVVEVQAGDGTSVKAYPVADVLHKLLSMYSPFSPAALQGMLALRLQDGQAQGDW